MIDELDLLERLESAAAVLDQQVAGVDVAPAVLRRIGERSPGTRRRRWALRGNGPLVSWRSALAAVATVALAAGLVVAAVPSARHTVARWFGVGAVEVRRQPVDTPPPTASPDTTTPATTVLAPSVVDLFGPAVTADEARRRTGLVVPLIDGLGTPSIHIDERPPGGGVVVVYPSSDASPATNVDGVGVMIEVLRGEVNRPIYAKLAAGGTTIVDTEVGGLPGLFLGGDAHLIAYIDADGEFVDDTARLAGNTVLWDVGELTYRLESALPLEQAVALAEKASR